MVKIEKINEKLIMLHTKYVKYFLKPIDFIKKETKIIAIIDKTSRPKYDVKLLKERYCQMKCYKLSAVVDGDTVKLKKSYFSTRDNAIDYMFNYFNNHFIYGMQVEDEHIVNGDKHSIEYVCNDYNRFTVTRENA